mmetsp:Transcript_9764/g.36389  ORF Transcript_9764/g.36389 Transcript_9764/m.36389 type:complete len:1246 (-) Transcript_9764:151-3888(-)
MRKYLQYLVGSQKTHYIQQNQPNLLKKKNVSENFKEQSLRIQTKPGGQSDNGHTDDAPHLMLDVNLNEIHVLSYSTILHLAQNSNNASSSNGNKSFQSNKESGSETSSTSGNASLDSASSSGGANAAKFGTQPHALLLTDQIQAKLAQDAQDTIKTLTNQNEKLSQKYYYVALPADWFEFKRSVTPSALKTKDPTLLNVDQSSAGGASSTSSDTLSSSDELSSPGSTSFASGASTVHIQHHIEKVTTLNTESEMFRKTCFACVIPHSSVLYLVTSVGMEAIYVPEVERYLSEKHLDKLSFNNTLNGKSHEGSGPHRVETQISDDPLELSSADTESSFNNATSTEKKVQKHLWLTIHTILTNDVSQTVAQALTLHICACLVQDRNLIACGDSDGYIRFYSLQSKGALQFSLPSASNPQNGVSSSAPPSPTPITPPIESSLFYSPHNGPISDILYSPQSDSIISAGIDGTCRLWSLKHRRLVRILIPPSASNILGKQLHLGLAGNPHVSQSVFTPPSPNSLSSGEQKSEQFFASQSIRLSPVTKIDMDARANILTVGHLNGELRQYNLSTGVKVLALGNKKEKQCIKSLAVLSRSQFLVFANERQIVRVWDILQERENSRFTFNTSQCMLYTDRRDVLFLCSESGDIHLHKGFIIEILKKERKLQEINTLKLHTSGIRSVWYHSDCDMLVTIASNGQMAIVMDIVTDSINQLDDKLKSQLMDHFYDYNIQVSNLTEEQKVVMIRELTSTLSKYPEEQDSSNNTDGQKESTSTTCTLSTETKPQQPPAFHRTQREQKTFEVVIQGLKRQSLMQPQHQRLTQALDVIQREKEHLDDQLKKEHVASRTFLKHNHVTLRKKYVAYINPKKIQKIKKTLLTNYETEKETMKKRHQQELEALKQKHKKEKDEFLKKKDDESTNAAKTYMSVKQTYLERIKNLDIESARLLHRLISRLNVCPTPQFHGIDPAQYKILSLITENATRTYVAVDFEEQKLVAIKAFPPGIHLLDNLEHKRLVPVHEILCTDSHTFVIMKQMHSNLYQYLKHESSFLKKQTIQRLLYDLLLALEYIHEQGMAHREVRPSNIFLDGDTHAYLSHFGIMKSLMLGQEEQEDHVTFSAPELYANSICFASDIWSVGIVFGFLLQTDRERQEKPLVNGEDPFSILHSMIQLSEPSLEDIRGVGKGNPIFEKLSTTAKYDQLQFKISCATEEEIALLKLMLKFHADKRAKVSDLKRHRYFSSLISSKVEEGE